MSMTSRGSDMIMYEEEFSQIKEAINRLRMDSNARMVFLVDRNGQQIAAQGDTDAGRHAATLGQ